MAPALLMVLLLRSFMSVPWFVVPLVWAIISVPLSWRWQATMVSPS